MNNKNVEYQIANMLSDTIPPLTPEQSLRILTRILTAINDPNPKKTATEIVEKRLANRIQIPGTWLNDRFIVKAGALQVALRKIPATKFSRKRKRITPSYVVRKQTLVSGPILVLNGISIPAYHIRELISTMAPATDLMFEFQTEVNIIIITSGSTVTRLKGNPQFRITRILETVLGVNSNDKR